jgi:hypothetical protein
MRRLMLCAALACMSLTGGCMAEALEAPAPLAGMVLDDQAVAYAFETADAVTSLVDARIAQGKLVPGTPKAKTVAGYLRTLKAAVNAASAAQRAGSASSYREAFSNAKIALAAIRAAVR